MAGAHINIAGMMDFRPVSAFSFLGRYRIIDFPISSMSNSDIENVHVYVSQNPRSLADHLGSGRIYNINSKRGNLQLLFNQDSRVNDIYNTDIQAYFDNMDVISRVHQPYVIITPGHMIFKQDYKTTAKLRLKNLKNAYNTIPDLRTPQLEIGFAVDLTWQAGHTYELEL